MTRQYYQQYLPHTILNTWNEICIYRCEYFKCWMELERRNQSISKWIVLNQWAHWLNGCRVYQLKFLACKKVNEINKFYKELRSEFLYGIELLKEALPWKHMWQVYYKITCSKCRPSFLSKHQGTSFYFGSLAFGSNAAILYNIYCISMYIYILSCKFAENWCQINKNIIKI